MIDDLMKYYCVGGYRIWFKRLLYRFLYKTPTKDDKDFIDRLSSLILPNDDEDGIAMFTQWAAAFLRARDDAPTVRYLMCESTVQNCDRAC